MRVHKILSQSHADSDRSQEPAKFTTQRRALKSIQHYPSIQSSSIVSITCIKSNRKTRMTIFRTLQRTALRSNRTPFGRPSLALLRTMGTIVNGDLNNTAAERSRVQLTADPAYRHVSHALTSATDDSEVRSAYRPFLQDNVPPSQDWVSQLELSTVLKMVDKQVLQAGQDRLKVLVIYGSMRQRYGISACSHLKAEVLTKTGLIRASLHSRPAAYYFVWVATCEFMIQPDYPSKMTSNIRTRKCESCAN
jgi:hypothetical protein